MTWKIKTLFASLAATLLLASNCCAISYLDWPTARKKSWNISTLSSSKLHKLVTFSLPSSGCSVGNQAYYTQGGVVTEDNYVFSYFCDNDANNNYIVFANRKTGKIIKKIKGNWWHMNSFYYKWGSGQVRVLAKGEETDACYTVGTTAAEIKKVNISKCKTSRQRDWGVPGVDVNGNSVSKDSAKEGRLTGQGEAVYDGYGYTIGWDSARDKWGQQWYKQNGLNALFVYDTKAKKLLKTFYLPSPLAEGEDVSVDGDGNVYLWYNLGRGKSAAMYKINKSDLNLPKNETQKAAEEKAQKQKSDNEQKQKENTTESDDSKKSDDASKTDDSSQSASDNSDKSDKSDASAIPDAEKPKTAILKTDSVMGLLDLIVEIMRIGIPILGALGVVLFGLQYLTAGGDEAKVRKAKRRILEVIIGLVAYAVASALFVWLGV